MMTVLHQTFPLETYSWKSKLQSSHQTSFSSNDRSYPWGNRTRKETNWSTTAMSPFPTETNSTGERTRRSSKRPSSEVITLPRMPQRASADSSSIRGRKRKTTTRRLPVVADGLYEFSSTLHCQQVTLSQWCLLLLWLAQRGVGRTWITNSVSIQLWCRTQRCQVMLRWVRSDEKRWTCIWCKSISQTQAKSVSVILLCKGPNPLLDSLL